MIKEKQKKQRRTNQEWKSKGMTYKKMRGVPREIYHKNKENGHKKDQGLIFKKNF